MGTSVNRIFLGWDTPFLSAAADYLVEQKKDGKQCNFEDTLIVLPVSRAKRRLEELLVAKAEAQDLWLIPPEIITTGALPELILSTESKQATRLERVHAWARVLKEATASQLQTLYGSDYKREEENDLLDIAEQIANVHRELAGADLGFADVAATCQTGDFDFFDKRWEVLAELAQSYEQALEAAELCDKDIERRKHVQQSRKELNREIFLLGTADLNLITKKLLTAHTSSLHALIFAPESEQASFDEFGCIDIACWTKKTCQLQEDQMNLCLDADGQAKEVATFIARHAAEVTAEEISVGVTSDDFIPYIEQQLEVQAIPCRVASGRPLTATPPLKLLDDLAALLASGAFSDFAAFVRHPDQLSYLGRTLDIGPAHILKILDRYQREHLQAYVFHPFPGDDQYTKEAEVIRKSVLKQIESFMTDPKSLRDWQERILSFVQEIYGHRVYQDASPGDKALLDVFRAFAEVLSSLNEIQFPYKEKYAAAETLRILLDELGRISSKPKPMEASVEILGWLELTLDDAPYMCIAGMNEQFVPESVNADLFLPNQLRQQLQLLDNDRRFARDIYALNTMIHSKKGLQLLFAKRNSAGDPLSPSRLLFLDQEQVVIDRVRRFLSPVSSSPHSVPQGGNTTKTLMQPPPPEKLQEPPSVMSVTSFRDYIVCPYRYYLKHVLGLTRVSDDVYELDALGYGRLIHDIVKAFGLSDLKESTDPQKITAYLLSYLEEYTARHFGRSPLPAVLVQLEQVKLRLIAFANFQAEWCASGWKIHAVERSPKRNEVFLHHDSGITELTGRLDRIDIHSDGRIAVFDYKTGDMTADPVKSHIYQDGWVDLQLPLYTYMLRQMGYEGEIISGYISMPRQEAETDAYLAPWSDTEIQEAVDIACSIANDVYQQKFWPPSDWAGKFDDFADLLGTKQFGEGVFTEESS